MTITADWEKKAADALAARPKCSECMCVLNSSEERFWGKCMHCRQEETDEIAKVGRRAYEARQNAKNRERCRACDATLQNDEMEDGICAECR